MRSTILWNMVVPLDNTTLVYKILADVNVDFHVEDSVGFFANDTSVLNLIFQQANVAGVGNLSK